MIAAPNLTVVSFAIDHGEQFEGRCNPSLWQQLSLTALMQRFWADNQVECRGVWEAGDSTSHLCGYRLSSKVSATVSFDPETEGPQLPAALDFFQYHLKGVSFLPKHNDHAYAQMPLEAITGTCPAVCRIGALWAQGWWGAQ